MSNDEEYRRWAEDCLALADKSINPSGRERWQRIARQWLDLITSRGRDQVRQEPSSSASTGRSI